MKLPFPISIVPAVGCPETFAPICNPVLLGGDGSNGAFVLEVKTDNVGPSNDDQFTIPHRLGYSYNYDWQTSDGTSGTHAVDTDLTLTFPSGAGTYQILIGVNGNNTFDTIYFNDVGDKSKVLRILSFGNIAFTTLQKAFYGCDKMTSIPGSSPNGAALTSIRAVYRDCFLLNTPVYFNLPLCTVATGMLRKASAYDKPIVLVLPLCTTLESLCNGGSAFNSSVRITAPLATTTANMFKECTVFDQNISALEMQNVVDATDMFLSSGFSTTNYDRLLNINTGWPSQALQDSTPFSAGTAKYTSTNPDVQNGRDKLTDAIPTGFAWTVLDGGPV